MSCGRYSWNVEIAAGLHTLLIHPPSPHCVWTMNTPTERHTESAVCVCSNSTCTSTHDLNIKFAFNLRGTEWVTCDSLRSFLRPCCRHYVTDNRRDSQVLFQTFSAQLVKKLLWTHKGFIPFRWVWSRALVLYLLTHWHDSLVQVTQWSRR